MTSYLTRRQLYDLIWAHPISDVASHLGLQEWTIRQICERHRVPLPKAVFWRDRAAGKKAKQTIFASTADPALELITFEPTKTSEPLPAWEPPIPITKTKPPKRVAIPRVAVESAAWQRVERPHPLFAATARALRSTKPNDHGGISVGGENVPSTSVAPESVERAIFVLDNVIRGLITRGMALELSRQAFTAARGEDSVSFKLSEKIAKVKHEPTLRELQAEAHHLRHGGSNHDWFWSRAYPQFDFVPTGTLRLSITSWGGMGRRSEWQDRKRFSLESQISAIVAGLDDWIDGHRQNRLDRERDKRVWRRRDENRGRAEARQKREGQREVLVSEIIDLGTKAGQLRTWIEWATPIEDPDTRRMLAWARERLTSIERALKPESFGAFLRERNLFPETDPYAPLPVDPDAETDAPTSPVER